MILSSRQSPPRLPTFPPTRSPPYNTLSVASGIHLLQNSPLPSPSLPSILPRHGKKPPKLNSKAIIRFLTWLVGLILLFWVGKQTLHREWSPVALDYQSTDGRAYEIVGDDTLPDHPTPVVVIDHKGRSKWTISIPQRLNFPLKASDYYDICAQAQDVSQHVADLKSYHDSETAHHSYYYYIDPHFIDTAEAQDNDMLPRPSHASPTDKSRVCSRSLTYVLDSSSGGLAPTLMGLWLAYSLAKKEDRAFFIDDTRWEYGSYSKLFHAPPAPDCLPPPKEQRVPCPHQARHLVVSEATTQWTFGAAFLDAYEDRRKTGVERLEQVFEMLREGYDNLFKLKDEGDVEFLNQRIQELSSTAKGLEVAVHVRHGERHPYEFQYSGSYVPISKYVEAAQEMAGSASRIIIASDDPAVYEEEEVQSAGAQKAQTRLSLTPAWGGGFFSELFWALGKHGSERMPIVDGGPKPSRRAISDSTHGSLQSRSEKKQKQEEPTAEAKELRDAVARTYLLDLAILGQADRVVCAVSSHTCRVLAVMMGWERAVEKGEWRNVDGDWGWKGLDW